MSEVRSFLRAGIAQLTLDQDRFYFFFSREELFFVNKSSI